MKKLIPAIVMVFVLFGAAMAATPATTPFTYKILDKTATTFTVPQQTITPKPIKPGELPTVPSKIKWPTPSIGPTTISMTILGTKTSAVIITTDTDFIGPQHPLMPTSIFTRKPIIIKTTTTLKSGTITITYTSAKPKPPLYTASPTTTPKTLLTVKNPENTIGKTTITMTVHGTETSAVIITTDTDFIGPQHPLMPTSIFTEKTILPQPTLTVWPTRITISELRTVKTWITIAPKLPSRPPIVVPIVKTEGQSEKYATMYVTFILRDGGYTYVGQDYSNGTVTVKFVKYDFMPAPMVIMPRRIAVTYPATAKPPKVIGVAYHYDAKGYLEYVETIPQGPGFFRL